MKSKVLALFDPAKSSWIAPIESLKSAYDVEYLWNYGKDHHFATESTVHHFNDFQFIQEVFDKIQPKAIFFMSIDTGLSIAMNLMAQRRGIKTFLLQHGYFGSFKDYETIGGQGRQVAKSLQPINPSLRKSVKSYLLLKHPMQFARLVFFLSLKKNRHAGAKGVIGHFSGRRPTKYLLWSAAACDRFVRNDGAQADQIVFTGNFEFYEILNSPAEPISWSTYYLLIDSPLSENSYGLLNLTREAHAAFYRRLASYASNHGKKLVVKLHPEMYSASWLPHDQAIVYARNEFPITQLIKHSELCFSFYSTLLIPAVMLKPVVVFEVFEVSLTKFLKDKGICAVLDFGFEDFENLKVIDNTRSDQLESFKVEFCGTIEKNPYLHFLSIMLEQLNDVSRSKALIHSPDVQ